MNKPETIKLFAIIGTLYPREEAFKNATSEMVSVWAEMLDDVPYDMAKTALKMHVVNSNFPPSIAELREKVAAIRRGPNELSADEAWALVMKAIRNSAYYAKQEFEKLPEICQKLVGSSQQLKEWAISESFNAGVEKSLFERSYNVKMQQMHEEEKLPKDVIAFLRETAKNMEIGDGQKMDSQSY